MKRVILTGFEPFGPYKYNPVQDMVKEYISKKISNVEVIGLVLPCTYYGAFNILSEKINELNPDFILSSGLASSVKRIRIESMGQNIMNGKYADAEGRRPFNEPIIKNGKATYSTNSNGVFLNNCLYKNNIPSEISIDADRFICNSLIYLTSRRIEEEELPIKFAFFHTPWTSDYSDKIKLEEGKVTISKDQLRSTIDVLISNLEKA